MLAVKDDAVAGKSVCPDTNPVIRGDNVLIADGINSNAVYTVAGDEPVQRTASA